MKIIITVLVATMLCITPVFAKNTKHKNSAHHKVHHKKKSGAKLTHHHKKASQA